MNNRAESSNGNLINHHWQQQYQHKQEYHQRQQREQSQWRTPAHRQEKIEKAPLNNTGTAETEERHQQSVLKNIKQFDNLQQSSITITKIN